MAGWSAGPRMADGWENWLKAEVEEIISAESLDAEVRVNGQHDRMPARMVVARSVCRCLPPVFAQRVRSWLYPIARARRDDFQFTARSITGSWFTGTTGDFHAYPFSVQGYYEWRNLAVALAVCRAGDTILEIGANIGTETVGYRDTVGNSGHVMAVEPFPRNCQMLQRLVQLNNWRNVEVLPMALADKPGEVSFVSPPNDHATGVGHMRGHMEDPGSSVLKVACSTLDELAAGRGRIHAIFMDTEGAEYAILQGGKTTLSESLPFIVLEASPKLLVRAGSSLQELRRMLGSLGYALFSISRFGLKPVRTAAPGATNWFCAPRAKASVARGVSRMIAKCAWRPPCMSPLGSVVGIRDDS